MTKAFSATVLEPKRLTRHLELVRLQTEEVRRMPVELPSAVARPVECSHTAGPRLTEEGALMRLQVLTETLGTRV